MRATDDVRKMLESLDPAAGDAGLPDSEQRGRNLQRILTSAPHPSRPRQVVTRRRLLVAGGLAAVTAAAAVSVGVIEFGQRPAAAYAATPPALDYRPPTNPQLAAERLRQLAGIAAAAPAPARPSGTVEHLRSANWFLNSAISRGNTTSVVSPEEWESWRTDDDGGRLVKRSLPPIFQSGADRQAWLRLGGRVEPRQDVTDYPPGRFREGWEGPVPRETTALGRWLAGDGGEREAPVQYLEDIAELAGLRLLGPAERAAVLRLLAELPGMTVAGTVVDRSGRTGEAFAIESDFHGLPTRYIIIIDPSTGGLLGYEEMLTTTAGKLNVRIPAVISYRCYLTADYAPMPQ